MTALSDPVVQRLGWALVHTLWEGAVAAALLWIALRVMCNRSADARYAIAYAALAVLAALPVVNFVLVPRAHDLRAVVSDTPAAPPAMTAEPDAGPSGGAAPVEPAVADFSTLEIHAVEPERVFSVAASAVYLRFATGRLEPLFPWLVAGWAAGVMVLSLWHLGGWVQVQRIRRAHTSPLGGQWDRKLAELRRRVGVSQPVRLFESALVKVPAVVGWLRPVILVPTSALSGLSPQQLEAILAHELAHVRRHDYLVNILQAVVETVLFYHPAVWWVSRQVRAERENCCDDVASRACGGAVAYARALAALEELRSGGTGLADSQFAVAADGAPLLRRIRRLVGRTPSNPAGRARAWPAAAAATAIVLPLLPLLTDPVNGGASQEERPAILQPDTTAARIASDLADDAGQPTGRDTEFLAQTRDAAAAALNRARDGGLSEKHPDVVLLRKELASAEERLRLAPAGRADGGGQYFISGVPRAGAYSLGKRPVNLLQALIAGGLDVESTRGKQVVLIRRNDAGGAGAGEGAGADGAPRETMTVRTVGELLEQRHKDSFLNADDIILLRAAGPAGAPGAAAGPPKFDRVWALVAETLAKAGVANADHVAVLSAYRMLDAGTWFVALRVPGTDGDQSLSIRIRNTDKGLTVDRSHRGELGEAGTELDGFLKEFPNAQRFADPFSVPPLKPPQAAPAEPKAG